MSTIKEITGCTRRGGTLICVWDTISIVNRCYNWGLPGPGAGGGTEGSSSWAVLDDSDDGLPLSTASSDEISGSKRYLKSLFTQLNQDATTIEEAYQWFADFYGDQEMFNADWRGNWTFFDCFSSVVDEDGRVSDSNLDRLLLASSLFEGISSSQITTFVERWNRTVDYWERGINTSSDVPDGDSVVFIDKEVLREHLLEAIRLDNEAIENGYDGVWGALIYTRQAIVDYLASVVNSKGVCANVKLELKQKAALTRDAFDATLVLENATLDTLRDASVEMIVYDQWGNNVTDKFGIRNPQLENFYNSENGNLGDIEPGTTGRANWIFVPSTECAKNGPEEYSVGGILHYTIEGREVSVVMAPVSITVYPQPELELNYFWQRDVIGDDPWTDEVEASEPFELAVMVQNKGAGDARDLRIVSAQPKIVENEKGLLVDFTIVGSKLNGQDASNSLTVDFGMIPAGGVAVGQWFMESTLQGHFIDYNATFQHVNGFDDLQFSLIKNVSIHELIHTVKDDSFDASDNLPDFLVNDVATVVDVYDLPDTLYLSSGEVESVATTTNYSISGALGRDVLTVDLTVAAADAGWNYVWVRDQDPGADDYELYRVVRSDGKELDEANFWQTHRTFIDGVDVKNENTLHMLDKFDSASDSYTYRLYYRPADQVGPTIERLEELPSSIRVTPLESVDVEFDEPIDASTFTTSNLTLTRNGGQNLIDSFVTIQQISDKVYRITGLSSATGSDGAYALSVSTLGVTDVWGNVAETSESVLEWTNAAESPTVVAIDQPAAYGQNAVDSLTIVFSLPGDAATFDLSDLTLTRDSGGNLLTAGSGAKLTARSATEWVLSGLTALTGADGEYEFRVKATGVRGTNNMRGVGVGTVSWIKDTVGPSNAAWSGVDRDVVNVGYDALYLGFDEPIDFNTLSRDDLTLTRNGEVVSLDERLVMGVMPESLKTTDYVEEWKLVGLRNFASEDGDYVMTVDLANVADLAGNWGSGTFSVAWKVDASAPTIEFTQRKLLSNSEIELIGLASKENVDVVVYDSDSNVLFSSFYSERDVEIRFAISQEGAHELRVRVSDAAGAWTETTLNARIDRTSPYVEAVSVVDDVLNVQFSEATNIGAFVESREIGLVVSVVDETTGRVLDLPFAAFDYDAATKTLGIALDSVDVGARDVVPLTLKIDGSRVSDAAGN
ncbi:MAG: hypothetical protein IKX88_02940, partial [Thermoguttaceae bacterium]|nr:hypothetical protein [Thermoguttaceae bacterium]